MQSPLYSDKIKFALVGCGAITELYYRPALESLMTLEQIEITALVDPNPSRRALIGKFFPSAKQVSSVDDLGQGDVDIAIVASPQRYHAAQAIALFKLGVNVLCEKPMASNEMEARLMLDASKRSGKLLSVGLFRRFFPSSETVGQLVKSEALGKALSFTWVEGGPFNWPAASASFFRKADSPGGVFADVGTHIISLLLSWFGHPVDTGYEDDAMGGIEANALLRMSFASGVTGSIRLTRDTVMPNETRIVFERGVVSFQGACADSVMIQMEGCTYLAKAQLVGTPTEGDQREIAARTYSQSFTEQIRNLCRAFRGTEPLRVTGEEATATVALIEKCYASRKTMSMPWLSDKELSSIHKFESTSNSL